MAKRRRVDPSDDWQQLQLLAPWPEQLLYEALRPVVLFGQSPAERAGQTGVAQRSLYRLADRFDQEGMRSLFAPPPVEKHRRLPQDVRDLIRTLKAEYPPLRPNEIATICSFRSQHHPSPHTVKRILAEEPPLAHVARQFPPYHQIADPVEARLALVRLHAQGWNVKSIAGYMGVDRHTVYAALRRWFVEGVAGLPDKSHARLDGVRKVDLRAIEEVRRLQANPELGAWRVHAALKQIGIELSPRTCGRILARNRRVYGLSGPIRELREPKAMPFQAVRRHQYWTTDIRYIDNDRVGGKIYCISILENYSRAILASALSRSQDTAAYLMVLFAAIRQHGAPEALVSDSGGVFRAKQAERIYAALGIRKERIEKGRPWQSYIETAFSLQRRLADWDFARAETWADLLAVHDQWVVNANYQEHWAHRQREDGRRSPAEVLGWVHGMVYEPEELHRIFYRTRFGRRLDKMGYARFRHWRVYAEQGLAGEHVAVWLYAENLTLEFADEALSRYKVTYTADAHHLASVTDPQLYETAHRSPQLPLWELGNGDWLKVLRLALYAPRRRRVAQGLQYPLFRDDEP
jgi:putative transposase